VTLGKDYEKDVCDTRRDFYDTYAANQTRVRNFVAFPMNTKCVAACCSVLQCVAECHSVL